MTESAVLRTVINEIAGAQLANPAKPLKDSRID
jgi:hypothetical protein